MKTTISISFLLVSVLLASCISTNIKSSWRETGKEISIGKLNKVLVVALFKNEASRRTGEDEMAGYLKGKGVVSYNYLDNNISTKDSAVIKQKIKSDGFDGAVIMRLVDVDKEITYIPGTITTYPAYYRNFSGYYNRSYSAYATPGRYITTKTFTVEVNVYSIKEDKIIWSGITETTNPDGVDKLTKEVTKIVYKKMLKEGFISK